MNTSFDNYKVNNNTENVNMEYDTERVSVINNESDYSNVIPTEEGMLYLVKYLYSVYQQFTELVAEDEKKNSQFKQEFKNYMYKKNYGTIFSVNIREKGYNNILCKDFETFETAVRDGNLKNIDSMDIKMNLNYGRGSEGNIYEHENEFSIIIKPFNIIIARKSNYNESNMASIENNIKELFSKLPQINCIFCTK